MVIPNDKQMRILIKFLVYRIKTIDGIRNSALPLLDYLNTQSMKAYMEKTHRSQISKSREHQIMGSNEYKVYKRVCLKYTIIMVRNKISYHAFLEQKTIVELFIFKITLIQEEICVVLSEVERENKAIMDIVRDIMHDRPNIFKKIVDYYSTKNNIVLPNQKALKEMKKM